MSPFKELLFLQGHVTQPTLLEDVEAAPQPAVRTKKQVVRLVLVPPVPHTGRAVGGCG